MFEMRELCRRLRPRGTAVTNLCGDGYFVAGDADTGTSSRPRTVFAGAALAHGADRNLVHPGRVVVGDLGMALVEVRRLGCRQDWLAVTHRGAWHFVFPVVAGGCYCRVDVGIPWSGVVGKIYGCIGERTRGR